MFVGTRARFFGAADGQMVTGRFNDRGERRFGNDLFVKLNQRRFRSKINRRRTDARRLAERPLNRRHATGAMHPVDPVSFFFHHSMKTENERLLFNPVKQNDKEPDADHG